jgi:hypothetical protein
LGITQFRESPHRDESIVKPDVLHVGGVLDMDATTRAQEEGGGQMQKNASNGHKTLARRGAQADFFFECLESMS